MILYIIKSVLCSALFIAAYHLLLEKEIIHRFKRWYLLLTLLLSLGIPLITIEIDQSEHVTQLSRVTQYLGENTSPDPTQSTSITPENTSSDFSWPTILFVAIWNYNNCFAGKDLQ
jgi:hypothetical protein